MLPRYYWNFGRKGKQTSCDLKTMDDSALSHTSQAVNHDYDCFVTIYYLPGNFLLFHMLTYGFS